MKVRFHKAGNFMSAKRIKKADVLCIIMAVLCLSFLLQNYYRYDLQTGRQIPVKSPWLVKADKQGNYYVVDDEKTRILKIVDGQAEYSISGAAPQGDTFYYAENICIGDNGSIFVQDTGWSETGFSLDYESILQYDARGNPLGVLYRVDYDDIYCDKHRLFGIAVRADTLYFVKADEDGFSFNKIDLTNREVNQISSFEMPDAVTLIQDFIIDTETQEIYAIDKRGRIYCASSEAGTVSLRYRLDMDKTVFEGQKVVLHHGSLGSDGDIYVTDIASEELLKFSADNGCQREVVLKGAGMWNVSFRELENGKELLTYVADGKIGTANADGTGIAAADQYLKSIAYMGRELLFDLAVLGSIITFIYLLIRGFSIVLTMAFTNIQKIGALMIVTVIAVWIIMVYGLMGQFKEIYRDELLTKLSMTAQIVSNSIDKKQLDEIQPPQNYMNASYRKLCNTIGKIVDKEYAYSKDIYCNILCYDGRSGYALFYQDNSISTFYPLTEDETKGVMAVYEQGIMLQSDIRSETGSYIYVLTPIMGDNNEVIGVVSVGTLHSVIDGKIRNMSKNIIIAMIMIIFAIMFLFSEALSFFELKDRYRQKIRDGDAAVPMHVVRVVVFITFLAFNMATSFLPVYVMGFVPDRMSIPAALANSLPLTVNVIFIGLTSLFCSRLIDRLGFTRLAVASGVIALSGDLIMASCTNYSMLLAGLSLNGIGVGLITNSIHIFIASIAKNQGDEQGFSIFNAASVSGINCGMLFGSALAVRLGQNRVFFVSALAWAAAALIFVFIGDRFMAARAQPPEENQKRQSMLRFIISPQIWKFMICIQLPYIVMNSFTYYYVPIYGNENGYTEQVISLLILACSLCNVYLSVAATGCLTRRFKEKAMYLSSLLTYTGLLIFAWKMSLPALLAALLLIGLADSFGSSTRISCFIRMKDSQRYGEENAMGAYNFVDNLGASAGSVIFAGIISVGFGRGISGLIGGSLVLSMVYALTQRKAQKDTDILSGGIG